MKILRKSQMKKQIHTLKIIFSGGLVMSIDKSGNSSINRPNQNESNKRGFSLPPTSSKPPMPPVKPPKKQGK